VVRLAFALFIFVLLFPLNGWSQTSDFFSNTQSVDKLSTGGAGACPNCPGFNPDTLIKHSGTDPDPLDTNITFSLTITTTAPSLGATVSGRFFNSLGPGAITDNMFGVISSVHRGADALPDTSDDEPARCALNDADGIPPDQADASGNGLNCGDLRFDPASQGMTTIPTFPATNSLAPFSASNNPVGDFFPSDGAHAGIELENRFIMTNNSTSDGVLTVPATGTCGASICVGAFQKENQVTALTGTPGTRTSPGAGEQIFEQTASWQITGSTATTFNAPVVSWTQRIQNPVFDGTTANREFDTGVMSGSFTRESGAATSPTTFPMVTVPLMNASPFVCSTGAPAGTCITIP